MYKFTALSAFKTGENILLYKFIYITIHCLIDGVSLILFYFLFLKWNNYNLCLLAQWVNAIQKYILQSHKTINKSERKKCLQ